MPRSHGVASGTDVVGAVGLEVGVAATGVAGKDLGAWMMVGGASKWHGDGGGGRGSSLKGRSTLHKGSRDSGSKSRKATDGGDSDIKGRSARVVTCQQRRSIAISRVRFLAISSWR